MSEEKTEFNLETDAVKGNFMEVKFFALICQKCGKNHLFFISHTGNPTFLIDFDREAEQAFLTKYNLPPDYIQEANLVICHCGLPIRLVNEADEPEKDSPIKLLK